MNTEQAIQLLAQMAQDFINTLPPSVRGPVGQSAQVAINVLTEATKPKPVETTDHA